MENNPTFINNPGLQDKFWDMFVIDSLIGNNDRNKKILRKQELHLFMTMVNHSVIK